MCVRVCVHLVCVSCVCVRVCVVCVRVCVCVCVCVCVSTWYVCRVCVCACVQRARHTKRKTRQDPTLLDALKVDVRSVLYCLSLGPMSQFNRDIKF